MSILNNHTIQVYDFENRDGETKYGFVIKFDKKDDIYTPYLTNSRSAIGAILDPIDFAEYVQDNGAKYMVTPNAIIFEDEESAQIAAGVLIDYARQFSDPTLEKALYDFAKAGHFGKKQWFVEQFTAHFANTETIVDDDMTQSLYDAYLASREGKLNISVHGGNEDKHYHVTAFNMETGILSTDEHRDIHISEASQLY